MQAPGAGWARVQLVRGQSGAQHWGIDGQYPEARLTIGSAPDAGWPVQGIGVQPYHLELFWDGRSLWVADTRRVGGVTVDGRAVSDWVQIRGRSEISFGSAGLQIETADAASEMASNPGEAKRVTVAPGDLDLGALGQWDDGALPGEATRVAPPPSEAMARGGGAAPGWGEMDPE
nr:FHA domain-containing protein [Myxococcota bacterium]